MGRRSLQLVAPDDVVSTVRFGDDAWVVFAEETGDDAFDDRRCRTPGIQIRSEAEWRTDALRERARAALRDCADEHIAQHVHEHRRRNERSATILTLRPET